MAQKPYPTNQYPGNPPVYSAASYPSAYPGAHSTQVHTSGQSTIVVQQAPVVVTKQRRGLFGQIGHELNQLGRVVSREVDWTADQINKSIATTATGNILSLFQSGNVIQLVSRKSGRSLQIVMGQSGQLVVDGLGQDGAPNATWTVVNEGNNQVRLHNQHNFLACVGGSIIVVHMAPGTVHGIETKFQLSQVGQFIYLESLKERGRHVGILDNGQLKPALATGKEQHSQFGVKLLHSPYGVANTK